MATRFLGLNWLSQRFKSETITFLVEVSMNKVLSVPAVCPKRHGWSLLPESPLYQ